MAFSTNSDLIKHLKIHSGDFDHQLVELTGEEECKYRKGGENNPSVSSIKLVELNEVKVKKKKEFYVYKTFNE